MPVTALMFCPRLLCCLLCLAWGSGPVWAVQPFDAEVHLRWNSPKEAFCLAGAVGAGVERLVKHPCEFSYRWDDHVSQRGGRVLFHLVLPPLVEERPMALFMSRVGNQARISLNGRLLTDLGTLDDSRFDAAKTARLVVVPPALLSSVQDNLLKVEITTQPLRWGGMSAIRYGPLGVVEPLYTLERRWRHTSYLLFAMAMMLSGTLAAALWWRQRDPLFGSFALAAFFGIARNIDRVWSDVWISWPLWGGIVAASYACHLLLICRFVLVMVGAVNRQATRAIWCAMTVCVALAVLSCPLRCRCQYCGASRWVWWCPSACGLTSKFGAALWRFVAP